MSRNNYLSPEDYMEPDCPLCMDPSRRTSAVVSIPQQRVQEKLDHYMNRKDYEGAERHLLYWLSESERGHDLRGRLLVCNELIGFYRKTGRKEDAFHFCRDALALLKEMDFEDSISAGTTYINAATAYSAFGEPGEALVLFRKARDLYETFPHTPPHLLGGLYNNMALACQALGHYEEASFGIFKVLKYGASNWRRHIAGAYKLLQDKSAPHDGYYAFICERCAPCFSYYGYFAAAEELLQEAGSIYERA